MSKETQKESLASVNPELAKQWHPIKNGSFTPYDITAGSGKKVWWKCEEGDDHEWEAFIYTRSSGIGCPICSGRKAVKSNCLATINPKLASEWHPTKNAKLTPFNITAGSNKKFWWKCDKGYDHEWRTSVNGRSNGKGCPFCVGQKVCLSNCLASINPKVATEWHPIKNGQLTPFDITEHSGKKVWWKCKKGDDHEWQISTSNRSNGSRCPFCIGQRVSLSNCLATVNPILASEWHPTKNGKLTPFDITPGSDKKIWWKCKKVVDHIWYGRLDHRNKSSGCPFCAGQKVTLSNCLATINPKLASEWHPTKNAKLTPFNVTVGSNKKVWWKCKKDNEHEWITTIANRQSRKCPYCTLTPQSREELIITHELKSIFKNIDPRGFKTKINGKVWSIDIYISKLKLGIEFDGSYWHKDKSDLDKLKTKQFNDDGFNIIRVRQKPLKRIFDSDVMAEKKYDGKAITNGVLQQILKDYKLDKRTLNKIHRYILKPDLQNEKGLDAYIDMILTEKAERKQLSR